jgi:prolyl-tRNA editing enzyme YbaK/EbsC (Cys-tRNA(Pro) deacylase)
MSEHAVFAAEDRGQPQIDAVQSSADEQLSANLLARKANPKPERVAKSLVAETRLGEPLR